MASTELATGIAGVFNDPRVLTSVNKIIGDERGASRFLRSALFAMQNVPGLAGCTTASLALALVQAATLRLEVGTVLGEAWILPYGAGDDDDEPRSASFRVKRAQLQVGYVGWQTLVRRAGVQDVQTHLVYADEEFEMLLGSTPAVRHKRALGTRDGVPVLGGYTIAWMPNSSVPTSFWMPYDEILKRRNASKSYQGATKRGTLNSPWLAYPETMERKTVFKGAAKWLPASEEIGAAFEIDNRADGIPSKPHPLLDQGAAGEVVAEFAEQAHVAAEQVKERMAAMKQSRDMKPTGEESAP